MSSKVGLYALIPALVAISFIAAAIGVNRWQVKTEHVSKYESESSAGLWKFCNKTEFTYTKFGAVTVRESSMTCNDIGDISTQTILKFISVVKYALFAALVCMVMAIVGTLVKHFVLKEWLHEKQQLRLGYITAILAFLTGVLAVMAFGVYNVELKYKGYALTAGFYLAVTAWILSWVSAAMFLAGSICGRSKMHPNVK